MNCKNCKAELTGTYCSYCGQKQFLGRFTLKGILAELISMITNIEKGFWHTLKMLFVNPSKVIHDYLNGITVPYYNPFRYLLIWVTIAVFINLSLGIFELQQEAINSLSQEPMGQEQADRSREVSRKMREFLSFFPLIFVPFLSLFSFWFFRSKGWNYAEHLIANAYLYAQLSIIGIIPIIIIYFNPSMILYALPIALLNSWIYYSYATRSIMDINPFKAIWKSFFVTLGGNLSAAIFISLLGVILSLFYILFNPTT